MDLIQKLGHLHYLTDPSKLLCTVLDMSICLKYEAVCRLLAPCRLLALAFVLMLTRFRVNEFYY